MFATFRLSPLTEARPFYLAVIAGLACAFVIGKALPSTMDAISAVIEPLCTSSDPAGSSQDVVEPISSHALPNVPGKRVTMVRVFYGPGGFTRRTAMPAPSPPMSPRARSARSSPAVRSKPSRSGSRSSSRPAPCIWSRPMPATPSLRN